MIVYLDTSAFLKLYLKEAGSDQVGLLVAEATAVFTHVITYAEMRAGFAQAVRMKRLTEAQRKVQRERFEADWAALFVIAVDDPLIRRAAELVERFELRGYDGVHLAAAETVWRQAPDSFRLAAFDRRLDAAARTLGMQSMQAS